MKLCYYIALVLLCGCTIPPNNYTLVCPVNQEYVNGVCKCSANTRIHWGFCVPHTYTTSDTTGRLSYISDDTQWGLDSTFFSISISDTIGLYDSSYSVQLFLSIYKARTEESDIDSVIHLSFIGGLYYYDNAYKLSLTTINLSGGGSNFKGGGFENLNGYDPKEYEIDLRGKISSDFREINFKVYQHLENSSGPKQTIDSCEMRYVLFE